MVVVVDDDVVVVAVSISVDDEVISTDRLMDSQPTSREGVNKEVFVVANASEEGDADVDGLTTYLPWFLKCLLTNANEAKQLWFCKSVKLEKFWNIEDVEEEFWKDI